jgi:hypothetical protein
VDDGVRLTVALGGVSGVVLGVILAVSALASAAMDERRSVVPEKLRGKALEAGWVRVIVQLRVTALPEGALGSADAVASQRQSIAAAQSALLAELAGSNYRVLRTYETIPFLALEVSPDALRALEGSALVMRVEEDRLDAPQTKPGDPASEKDHPIATPNSCPGR